MKVRIFLIPLSIVFLVPKILGFPLRKIALPGEGNGKNLTSENPREFIR